MQRAPWRPRGGCSVSPAARLCLQRRDAPLPLQLCECEARGGAAEAEREEGEVRRGRREEGRRRRARAGWAAPSPAPSGGRATALRTLFGGSRRTPQLPAAPNCSCTTLPAVTSAKTGQGQGGKVAGKDERSGARARHTRAQASSREIG